MSILLQLKYLPLYLIQKINFQQAYLYLIMPILGLFYYIKERKIPKLFWSYYLIFLTPLIVSAIALDLYALKRVVLTSLLAGFTFFLAKFYSKEELEKLGIYAIGLFVIHFIYEYFNKKYSGKTLVLFQFTPIRFEGMQAYSNHSGLTLGMLALLFFVTKRYTLSIFSFFLILLTVSRTAIAATILGYLLIILFNYFPKLVKLICKLLTLLCILSPLIFLSLEKLLTDEQKMFANKLTNGRYALNLTYIQLAFDKPFGVGVDQSHTYFLQYLKRGSSILENGMYEYPVNLVKTLGPHSLFTKVLCENGILSYFILGLFLWSILSIGLKNNVKITIIMTCLLIGFISLNGMTEFSFYFILAYLLKDIIRQDQSQLEKILVF